ncbi:MAG: phage major capsid protein [Lachnospiraceae bacterium]|nr:phage major capsid protein [Lachnospiraceae bacterium]
MSMKYLEEKKNDYITRSEEILNAAKAEERELTAEELKELDEINENVKKIVRALEIDKALEDEKTMEKKDDAGAAADEESVEAKEERMFEEYIRSMALGTPMNTRDGELTPAVNSAGATIPTTIANKIIEKVYAICPILEKTTKYNVPGKIQIPCYDDSTTDIEVAYASEFTPLASSNGKFVTIELDGFLAGALSKISLSLVNNSKFNITDYVVKRMARAIKRFIERELLNGTENKVEGLSSATNVVTAAATNAITADELIDVQDAVIDEYQDDAMWLMSSKTRTALRKLKDQEGRYILQDDVTAPFGKVLLGKPVYVSDNMPEIAAGNTAIIYGDMSGLASKFSEQLNIQVLREKFADEHAVGVVGWFEFDSKVEDQQKISKLVMKAS